MEWLGAALAFAITMLALSTVVTTTVETIHRIIGLREKGLRLMLGHFYDAVIAPHVDRVFANAVNGRGQFLDTMTANRAPTGDAGVSVGASRGFLSWIWGGRQLGTLSLEDFMGRLGDSYFGDAVTQIQSSGGVTALEVVLQDIAHKFEAFGRDASEYFQARARLVSVLVAFVIAWQCNINPLLLAQTFLRNPAVTAKINAAGPVFIDESNHAEEKLAATLAAANDKPATAATDATPDEHSSSQDVEKIDQQYGELVALGVPIGWTEGRLKAAGFTHTELWIVYPTSFSDALPTIAWLLLGGLLIGLGSPFWRDAVLSLTAVRDQAKSATAQAAASGLDPLVLAAQRFATASQARTAARLASTDGDTDVAVG